MLHYYLQRCYHSVVVFLDVSDGLTNICLLALFLVSYIG